MKNVTQKKTVLKYSWSKAEADMIRGLKRHLKMPVRKKYTSKSIAIHQNAVGYFQRDATITYLWDFTTSFWPDIIDLGGDEIYKHEITQCLNFLVYGKLISPYDELHEKMKKAVWDYPERESIQSPVGPYPRFKTGFVDAKLKEAAIKKDVPRLKLLADVMGKSGEKCVGIYHVLLNLSALKSVMEFAEQCGGFEWVDMRTLAIMQCQLSESSPVALDFKRFCIPYLAHQEQILIIFQEYSKLEEFLIPLLDAGASGERRVFPFADSLPAWRYFHFLGEIEPELSPLLEGYNIRLEYDLRAAKLYCAWEKEHPMTM